MRRPRGPCLPIVALPALAIAVVAVGGCGRGAEPPARTVAASPPASPAAAPAAVAAPDTVLRWREPREPYDRCRRADGSDQRPPMENPEGSVGHEDLSHGLAFLCTLRDGHPARLVLQGDASGIPTTVLIYDPPAAAAPSDTLSIGDEPGDAEPPYAGGTILEGEDLNGDGWADVRVMTYFGSGGRMFDVFRYDPRRGRFEKDTVLNGRGNFRHVAGTSCARSSWKTSAADHSWMEWCWRGGRWVPTQAESWDRSFALSTREVTVTIHERQAYRGGRMRVVSADTTRTRSR